MIATSSASSQWAYYSIKCALPECKVEIPGEVIRSLSGAESAVLSVVGFQAGEVPFQPVGSGRDVGIVEVVEHVGQSV